MSVLQMTPDEIYKLFISRIEKTNLLYSCVKNNIDQDTVEWENTLYFKYYFDVSTAIEATTRGITFIEGKKHQYITHIAKPSSDFIAYFKDYDEIKALCGLDKLFNDLREEKFKTAYFSKLTILDNRSISMSFHNDGHFADLYKMVRKTRNTLAHGLKSDSVDYGHKTLESFLFVFFVLHSYYAFIYSQST